MNYIELARAVRRRLGIQGSGPSSVDTTIPIERQILKAVSDVYIDIQNINPNWKWMRSSASFNTIAGTTEYSLATILTPTYRFSRWLPHTFYITVNSKKSRLYYVEYDTFQYRFANNTTNGKFSEFTIKPMNKSIVIPRPDSIYTITCDYQKSAQVLSGNTDTPELPIQFHNVILYGAMEGMGVSVASPEEQMYNAQKFVEGVGQLMRREIPETKTNVRSIA